MAMNNLSHRHALVAPGGADLIHWLSTDAGVRDRVLADGRHTVSYEETIPLLEELDALFTRCRASHRHPLALECSQTVAGAIALLFVLSREYDVVLLPELGESSKELGTPRFIPSFCSHVLTASAGKAGSVDSPIQGIELVVNDAFAAEPVLADFVGPDLYLRTSGSTGKPKLTRMSHRKWLNNAAACGERWKLTADDRLSVPVPIFHSYGFGAAFLPGLLAGAAMDVGSGGNILRYLERESRFEPNVAFLTPGLCSMFLSVRKTPRSYRLAVTAGDKIKRETMAEFESRFGPLLNLYGSAEMGAVSSASPDDPPGVRLGTAGYPLAGIELDVAEAGEEIETALGERVGRLQCRQKNGSNGYLIQEERWCFEPRGNDEWFDTGDVAKIRADGYVEIVGRSGLSAKRDGLLVVFAEVEAAVERVEGIQRAVVVSMGESRRGSRLVAVCLVDPGRGEGIAPGTVRRRCFECLPHYAVPDEVVTVESLPLLPSGKIDRCAIRELVLTGRQATAVQQLGKP
ncbi:MAG TPA: class I adenylate-forming enzyme family protein [Thermoanaerobaculia bacterium]|nr:class I adenylate-forming enzyme family protein [Thermoanaerobaculia bacterium]